MTDYWVEREGKRFGPFDEARVIGDYERGLLRPQDRLWTEGLAEALPLEEVFANLETSRSAGESFALEPMEAPPESAPETKEYRSAPEHTLDYSSDRDGVDVMYAGFWVRFGAVTLDTILIATLFLALLVILVFLCGMFGLRLSYSDSRLDAFSFFISWFYYAGLEGGEHSATLGKRAFNIQVVRAESFEGFGFLLGSARFLMSFVSYAFLGLGYLMQPFTPRRQALHDLATGTVVTTDAPCSALLLGTMLVIGVPGGIAGIWLFLEEFALVGPLF